MTPSICSLGLLLVFLTSVVQGILLIGPSKMYPNRTYSMVISNFLNRSVDLSMTLQDVEHSVPIKSINVGVRKDTNKLVEFKVPEDMESGIYQMSIDGNHGFSYHANVTVTVPDKFFSGLIQLNKPVYRPGESVNFRVIVLNSDLKPPTGLQNLIVKIKLPTGVTVKEFKNISLKLGVFEESFLIAPAPIIGKYKLVVEWDDEELVFKTFEVKEYVLSGLNVNVYLSRVPLQEHGAVDLTVSASNVLGQPVTGKINIALVRPKDRITYGNATHEVHGMKKVSIAMKNLNIYETSEQIDVKFSFTEQYTNRTIAKTVPITIFKRMYRANLIKEFPGFRPGKLYRVTIKLEYNDGTPAENVRCSIELDGTEETQLIKESNSKGEISLDLTPSDTERISLTVSVDDEDLLEEEIPMSPETNALIKIKFTTE